MEDIVSSSETTTRETTTVTVIQTCSVASELTGNDALVSDFVEQEESSVMDSQDNKATKWTNEKHSLYLKSIEASFVDQLYHSLDMQSCQTQSTNCFDAISTWKNHPEACNSSGKYKVLQRGRWSKKSFKKQDSHVKDADRPHFSTGNPWIQHFRNGSLKRLGFTATPAAQYHIPDSQLDQEPGCINNIDQHDTIAAEVIDQNFVEDTSCSRKRAKTANIDQVVPYFTSAATAIPNSYVFPKR